MRAAAPPPALSAGRTVLRLLAPIALVFALALASVSMATARHQAPAVGSVVICTGHGVVTLTLDAQGRPTGPVLPCPDCLPPALALASGAGPLPGPARQLLPVAWGGRDLPAPADAAPRQHRVRSPPVAL